MRVGGACGVSGGGVVGSPRWARTARIENGAVRKAINRIAPWQRGQVSSSFRRGGRARDSRYGFTQSYSG